MATRTIAVLLGAFVSLGFVPSTTRAALGDAGFVPGEVVCVVRPGGSIREVNEEYGTRTLEHVGRIYRLAVRAGRDARRVAVRMREDANVESSGLNVYLSSPNARRQLGNRNSPLSFPNDRASKLTYDATEYGSQPFVERLRISTAWTRATGADVVVAIVDTGVDCDHPALASHLLYDGERLVGYDFVDGDPDPTEGGTAPAEGSDDPNDPNAAYGHGTFIAGIVAKVAPDARIMPIRAFGPDGVGTLFGVIEAVAFARDHGADVVNMSFGAPERLHGLAELVASMQADTIFVAAAGNDAAKERLYPAALRSVLAIAAVDDDDVKAGFSNYGAEIDLAAPGVALVSAYPGARYATWSGTSFATPIVSATAALVLSSGTVLSSRSHGVAARLEETATPLAEPILWRLGSGRIDPVAALAEPSTEPDYSGASSSERSGAVGRVSTVMAHR
jgi:subtilisin family serine protease